MQTLSSESCATATAVVAAGQATSTSRANTAAIALPGRQQVRTAALRDAVTAGTKSLTVHVGVWQHMVAAQDHQQWGQGSYLGGARGQGSYLGGSWAPGAMGPAQLISKVVAQHNPWPLITGRGNAIDWAALTARRRQCTPPWHPAVSWIDTRAHPSPPSPACSWDSSSWRQAGASTSQNPPVAVFLPLPWEVARFPDNSTRGRTWPPNTTGCL